MDIELFFILIQLLSAEGNAGMKIIEKKLNVTIAISFDSLMIHYNVEQTSLA